MKILLLAFCAVLVIAAIWSLKKSNAILASINALWWCFFIIGGVLLFDTQSWSMRGLIYIELCCVALFVGEYLGAGLSNQGVIRKNNIYLYKLSNNIGKTRTTKNLGNLAWLMIVVFIMLGIFRVGISIIQHGFSISNFTNFSSFLSMNEEMAYQRYYGSSENSGGITQVILVFCYLAPLCGGYMFLKSDTGYHKIISVSSLFPIVLEMLFTNGKAGFIGSVFLWGAGFILAYFEEKKSFIKMQGKQIILVISLCSGIIGLLFLVMCFRIGDLSNETLDIVKKKIMEYAFGHVEAFEKWFEIREQESVLSMGAYTFLGISSKFGIINREQGIYGFMEGVNSNVYTAFRGIITDYGLLGGILFYCFIGILASRTLKNIVKNRKENISKVIWSSLLFFVLQSFAGSAWVYTSYILVFPCFYVFLVLANYSIRLKEREHL